MKKRTGHVDINITKMVRYDFWMSFIFIAGSLYLFPDGVEHILLLNVLKFKKIFPVSEISYIQYEDTFLLHFVSFLTLYIIVQCCNRNIDSSHNGTGLCSTTLTVILRMVKITVRSNFFFYKILKISLREIFLWLVFTCK